MKNAKNELMQFVAGAVMLVVGLFILSQKVIVSSSFFGYGGFSIGGIRVSSGLIIVPFIIGIIWMFATSASFPSKVFTALSVLLIVVSIILNTNIHMVSISLYEWVLILVLIFGGIGFLAKVLFSDSYKAEKKHKKDNDSDTYYDVDRELDKIRKKRK